MENYNHILYIRSCELRASGDIGNEISLRFKVKPNFIIQYRDKKYRFRIDKKGNLCIRNYDFKNLDVAKDDEDYPMLVIEGRN